MINKINYLFFLILFFVSCGQSTTDEENSEPDKKDTVNVAHKQKDSLDSNSILENEILVSVLGKHGQYGFQDSFGNWMIKPQYYFASDFNDGIAVVSLKGLEWEIINYKNEILQTFDIENFSPIVIHNELSGERHVVGFTEGKLCIQFSDGLNGFFDWESKKVSNKKFKEVLPFSNGLAVARIQDKFGYINYEYEWVIKPKYDNAFTFSDNRGVVHDGEGFWIIDRNEKKYNSKRFLASYPFKEGVTFVGYSDKNFGLFIIDTMGEIQNKGEFDAVYNRGFEKGECEVRKDEKCFIIDKRGKKIRDKKDGCQEGC